MPINNTTDQVTEVIEKFTPATLAAVLAVEATAKEKPGTTKLQTVVNAVMASAQVASGVPIPSVAAIASLVSLIVGILNATGIFNHGAKPAPVAAE